MEKLINLLKFISREMIGIEFNVKKGTGTKIFTPKGVEEDTKKVGNIVKVKDHSVIFRPAGGPENPDAHYTFQGKGPQDTEIKLDDINLNSIRFTLIEDDGKWTEFAVISQETKLKKRPSFPNLKKIFHKSK
jgi:hypothetical protein